MVRGAGYGFSRDNRTAVSSGGSVSGSNMPVTKMLAPSAGEFGDFFRRGVYANRFRGAGEMQHRGEDRHGEEVGFHWLLQMPDGLNGGKPHRSHHGGHAVEEPDEESLNPRAAGVVWE